MSFAGSLRRAARDRGIRLRPSDLEPMEAHYRLLCRWNPTLHLTSVSGLDAIVDRHFLESLAGLPYLDGEPGALVDVGSGNGFPAVPLLLARDRLEGRLLEPSTRKGAFLKEVLRETGLDHRVRVVRSRVSRPEDLAARGPFRYLTLRAVGSLATILPGISGGLAPGGRALLYLGRSGVETVERREASGLRLEEVVPLPGRRASFLVILTPD